MDRKKSTIYPCDQLKTRLEYRGFQVEQLKKTVFQVKMFRSEKVVIIDFISGEFRVVIDHQVSELKYTKDIIKTIEFIFSKRDGI